MTKQEEIREGIKSIAEMWFKIGGLAERTMPNNRSFERDVMGYLHDNDVVIKGGFGEDGYKAWEPLIDDIAEDRKLWE